MRRPAGAARHSLSGKVFVNFASNAICEAKCCLRSTVRRVDELGLAREQVVCEITGSARLPEWAHRQNPAGDDRDHGFGVALDDAGAGSSCGPTM